jgi:hypothetical protein
VIPAETRTPPSLHRFLADIEDTENSVEVWTLLVALGVEIGTPFIDFICASSFQDWPKPRSSAPAMAAAG